MTYSLSSLEFCTMRPFLNICLYVIKIRYVKHSTDFDTFIKNKEPMSLHVGFMFCVIMYLTGKNSHTGIHISIVCEQIHNFS